MKNKFSYLTIVCCLLILSGNIFSQKAVEKPFIASSNESGENASSFIDGILGESEQNNERVFVIVRANISERQTINNRRLRSTKQHFLNKRINLKNFVFAQGESVKDEGRIEFYLSGELKLVILAKKNEMPNLTCCDV